MAIDRIRRLVVLATSFSVYTLVAMPCHAQVATNITPTTGAGDLGTTVTPNGMTHTITGGTRPNNGPNLFHSFGQFSVGTAEIANFSNNTGLSTTNILNRVTGGTRSDIDGMIRTTGFPGANFFLINPAGVMFGSGASLDLQGSFHVSTADSIKLADGVQFNAAVPSADDALLSTAPPEAFGFLAVNGSLEVNGADLRVPNGETLSLSASSGESPLPVLNVRSGVFDAPGGRINIDEVRPNTELRVASSDPPINVGKPARLDVSEDERQQNVIARGRDLIVRGGAVVGQPLGNITVNVDNLALLNGGRFESVGILGDSGDVKINAATSMLISGEKSAFPSGIYADVLFGAAKGGDIDITAPRVMINEGRVTSSASGDPSSAGGNIGFNVEQLKVLGGGVIGSPSIGSGGRAGAVRINGTNPASPAKTIFISGQGSNEQGSGIVSFTAGKSNAGDIIISSRDLTVEDGGQLLATSINDGNAGNIIINTSGGEVNLSGDSTSITSETSGNGRAGNISVTTNSIRVSDGAHLAASTSGPGQGGSVRVSANEGEVTVAGLGADGNPGAITTESISNAQDNDVAGNSGTILIKAGRFAVQDGGEVRASTATTGAGGNLQIESSDIRLSSGGRISTESSGTGFDTTNDPDAGRAGSVSIDGRGGTVTLSDQSTSITSGTTGDGDAGDVVITRGGKLTVRDGAEISASTRGNGKGGSVNVSASNIDLINEGKILAQSVSTNRNAVSGNVMVQGGDSIRIFDNSKVSVETTQATAGDIDVKARNLLHLRNNSSISTSAGGGDGDGGNINIDPVFVVLDGGSRIEARARRGRGGNISITTDFLFQSPDSVIDASAGPAGIDGNVEIDSPDSDVIAGTLTLSESFLSASTLLGSRCAARAAKESSSFVVGGRGGVPVAPDRAFSGSVLDLTLPSDVGADTKPSPGEKVVLGPEAAECVAN